MRLHPAGVFDLLEVEDGSKGKSIPGVGGEGDKFDLGFAGRAANRAVGCAEVDTDRRDMILHLPHSIHYFAFGRNTWAR
jgi:hypothetical protein